MAQPTALTHDVPAAAVALQEAMLGGDTSVVGPYLAEHVTVVSPLTDRFSFEGRDRVVGILADAAGVLEGLRYTEAFLAGDRVVLRAEGHVRGARLEELVLLRLDADGLIAEITVFLRPFVSAAAFVRALTPVVARREGGRLSAFGAARLGGALAAGARLADAAGAKLVS